MFITTGMTGLFARRAWLERGEPFSFPGVAAVKARLLSGTEMCRQVSIGNRQGASPPPMVPSLVQNRYLPDLLSALGYDEVNQLVFFCFAKVTPDGIRRPDRSI